MGKLGFFFGQTACSGGRACQTACKERNDLPVLPPEDITHPGTIIKAKAAAGNPDFKQVIL